LSHSTISFLVLGGAVVLFVWGRIPVEIVALGAAFSLYATGVLTLNQSLAGFADPAVLFIAWLFVISEGLDVSGVTAWAGRELIRRAGGDRTKLLVYTMLLVAVLTAFISVNGAVAALLPVVVVIAVRLGWAPSRLLLPLAFAAHAGSMLALTGTPVSVIVSEAADEAHAGRFGYFDFALVGLPLVIGAVVIVLLFGERLLPERQPRVMPTDFSRHAQALVDQYLRDHAQTPEALFGAEKGVAEVVIAPRSGLVGATVFPAWSLKAARSWCSRSSGVAKIWGRARSNWPPATRSSSRAAGRPSSRTSTTRTCWSSTRPI
jgi:Na+/H+ antiporter NhaD/arsenite permease-like protein